MREHAASLSGLTIEQKRQLLKQKLEQRQSEANQEYALSYGQQALWFLSKLAPDMSAYNIAVPFCAKPHLHLPAFERAIARIVQRHVSLRTAVAAKGTEAVQIVQPAERVRVEVFKRPDCDAADLCREATEDLRRRFDLSSSVPTRVSIYRGIDTDVVLIAVHHIAFDAWSAGILFDDLKVAYTAELNNTEPVLQPLSATYSDFVRQQRAELAGPAGEEAWRYWSNKLDGDLPVLRLSGAATPSRRSYRGGSVAVTVEDARLAALRSIAQEKRTTLFTVLLVAWSVFLTQEAGQDEVIVGIPVSGRTQPEWEPVVGYFVNLVPVRLATDRSLSFADLIGAAIGTVHDALAHQDFPFSVLVDRLKVRRNASGLPVFQTIFNLHRSRRASDLGELFRLRDGAPVRFGHSELSAAPIPQQEGQFDVVLELAEFPDSLEGHVKYSDDVLAREAAVQLTGRFMELLDAVAANPSAPVCELLGGGSDAAGCAQEEDREEFAI